MTYRNDMEETIKHMTVTSRQNPLPDCAQCLTTIQPKEREFYIWYEDPGFCSLTCLAKFYEDDKEAMAIVKRNNRQIMPAVIAIV